MSIRFNSNLVTIWNRQGDNEKTKEGILAVVLEKVSPELTPLSKNCYYKKHSEHSAFREVVAKTKEAEGVKSPDAEVKPEEGDNALLKEAEGVDIKDLK